MQLDIGLIEFVPYVLTGGDDHKVKIWRMNMDNGVFEFQDTKPTDESDVISLAMHPFGDAIAAGTIDGRLYQSGRESRHESRNRIMEASSREQRSGVLTRVQPVRHTAGDGG